MKRTLYWLWNWRTAAGFGAGFLLGMLIFGAPWHLPPNWGDVPTWLLVALGGVAGVTGLYQFSTFVRNNAEEAERNIKRDELLDKQLAEAEGRAITERRRQAEMVELRLADGGVVYVLNLSPRPIFDITCRVMSESRLVAEPARNGTAVDTIAAPHQGVGQLAVPQWEFGPRRDALRGRRYCGFLFESLSRDADDLTVAWFTDDAGFRWQLDEYLHLAPAGDGDEYKP